MGSPASSLKPLLSFIQRLHRPHVWQLGWPPPAVVGELGTGLALGQEARGVHLPLWAKDRKGMDVS